MAVSFLVLLHFHKLNEEYDLNCLRITGFAKDNKVYTVVTKTYQMGGVFIFYKLGHVTLC